MRLQSGICGFIIMHFQVGITYRIVSHSVEYVADYVVGIISVGASKTKLCWSVNYYYYDNDEHLILFLEVEDLEEGTRCPKQMKSYFQ